MAVFPSRKIVLPTYSVKVDSGDAYGDKMTGYMIATFPDGTVINGKCGDNIFVEVPHGGIIRLFVKVDSSMVITGDISTYAFIQDMDNDVSLCRTETSETVEIVVKKKGIRISFGGETASRGRRGYMWVYGL